MAAITAEQKAEFVEAFQELATETGVVGVPRLVTLFSKRNGDVGLSLGTLTEIAREALQTKASKQILRFPRESTSGGAVSAGHKDHVWQADSASMFTFGGGYFLCVVDVFTRRTWLQPPRARCKGYWNPLARSRACWTRTSGTSSKESCSRT